MRKARPRPFDLACSFNVLPHLPLFLAAPAQRVLSERLTSRRPQLAVAWQSTDLTVIANPVRAQAALLDVLPSDCGG